MDHGAAIKPAVGYRIEYRGRSVVISGDTRYDPNVIKPTLDEVVAETRHTYAGPLTVGEDLMSFEIGDTVTVRRNKP